MKPILISGIQPTGRLHLGNYLGALKNFVELQNSGKYQCYFFIADYHSLTIDFDPRQKFNEVLDLANTYLTAGLDPKKSTIFVQSQVPECTELAWILNTIAPMGELNRITQFKDKEKKVTAEKVWQSHTESNNAENTKNISMNVGLFDYPVLMAADILLYNAEFVPVGEDQLQHLELTRTLARKFNNKFGDMFIEPKEILTKTNRIMSLSDPIKKMSKSQPDGCLFLDDSEAEIETKIKHAGTDSGSEIKYNPNTKPGISNLLLIFEALSTIPILTLEEQFSGKGYGQFKTDLAKIVADSLKLFRSAKISDSKLKSILANGNKKARGVASQKIKVVKKGLGLLAS